MVYHSRKGGSGVSQRHNSSVLRTRSSNDRRFKDDGDRDSASTASGNPIRNVVYSTSLSSRFSSIQEQRKASSIVARSVTRAGPNVSVRKAGPDRSGPKARRSPFKALAGRMEIDQGNATPARSKSSAGRPRPAQDGRGGGRGGGRGRLSNRGGGRGGSRGSKKAPLTQEGLDRDLDNYMMDDPKTAATILDQDIDNYMQTAN